MKKKLKIGILSISAFLFIICLFIGRNSIGNLISDRVHFPGENIGAVLKMEDGQNFTIIRWLKVDQPNESKTGVAVFRVRFRFKNLSPKVNKRLSIIPAPFLMGMENFREKIWTINESTNEFQGIYQWSTKDAADNYPKSFIFKLMAKRAAPGTVSYEIIPDTDLSDYLNIGRLKK